MKRLLLILALATSSQAGGIYRLVYTNSLGDGFSLVQNTLDPKLSLSTGDRSFGDFNTVIVDGHQADPTSLAAPGQATSTSFYARATISVGAETTQFEFGNGGGPFFSDFSIFEYSLTSISPGSSFTFLGSQIGTGGTPGIPRLTVTNLAPEPAALSLVCIGVFGFTVLLAAGRRRECQ